ncbi:hypothetical protein EHQ50_18670 [Leptospira meyeri]|nr:hypothetical protein EHQ50_18670 [Leptospira meyeri]
MRIKFPSHKYLDQSSSQKGGKKIQRILIPNPKIKINREYFLKNVLGKVTIPKKRMVTRKNKEKKIIVKQF